MPKCRKCKRELILKGFERHRKGEEIDIYACQTKGCTLKDVNINHSLPTSTIKEGA